MAATKTYTAQLTVIAMLASALKDDEGMWDDLSALPNLAADTLDRSAGIAEWAERYRAQGPAGLTRARLQLRHRLRDQPEGERS